VREQARKDARAQWLPYWTQQGGQQQQQQQQQQGMQQVATHARAAVAMAMNVSGGERPGREGGGAAPAAASAEGERGDSAMHEHEQQQQQQQQEWEQGRGQSQVPKDPTRVPEQAAPAAEGAQPDGMRTEEASVLGGAPGCDVLCEGSCA